MSIQITFLGHSTVSINTGTMSFLTDPVLSDRIFFWKRHTPLSLPTRGIAEPTAILISHAHYDHLDLPTFKYFSSRVPVILPQGLGKLVSRFTNNPIIEIPPHGSHEIAPSVRITAFPVSHDGSRLSGLTYRGCNGYWIESEGTKIFFPGDTGYRTDFKSFRNPDIALLPIGPCRPGWFMRKRHLNPEDALQVLEDTGAKIMIPIHWGCFRLGLDPVNETIETLKYLVTEKKLQDRVRILAPGESFPV